MIRFLSVVLYIELMKRHFLSFFTCLVLICSINLAYEVAGDEKDVTISMHVYEKYNEEYTISGDIYNYVIRLVDTSICDPDLWDGSTCTNTIRLHILQKDKFRNETLDTVVVPSIIRSRNMPMGVEFKDISFDSIFVSRIDFDKEYSDFTINYTKKDLLRNMATVYSGEIRSTAYSIYLGEGDTVYTMTFNRSADRLIVNFRDTDSKTLHGQPGDIIPFDPIMVKVLSERDGAINFRVYSSTNIRKMTKSEISLRKGEMVDIDGSDLTISDANNLSAKISLDNQNYEVRRRHFKGIKDYIVEVRDIVGDNVQLNIYHPDSVNIIEYSPNVSLEVTKSLEPEEGELFEIPFTVTNTGRVGANDMTVNLQSGSGNIIEGSWRGRLGPGETKDLVFRARFNTEGNYLIVFNLDTGRSSEVFEEQVRVRSKVATALKEGPINSLVFIAREHVVNTDRVNFVQNSLNTLFYVGLLLSAGILINSARQKIPSVEPPRKKILKRRNPNGPNKARMVKRKK